MEKKETTKNKERRFILECIKLYRNLPALWNIKSKLYHDRDQKNMAYKMLLSKYKEMFVDATKEDVKRKFNVLRTNYRKELRKHLSSLKSGDSDSVYESSLWYFEDMSFLHDQKQQLESESSMDAPECFSVIQEQTPERQASTSDANGYVTFDETPKQKAVKRARKEGQLLDLAFKRLSEKQDEFYYWAMDCASNLRKMEKTQQLYAKKAVSDILMEGQFGLLHRHSVKINEESFTGASSVHINPSPSPTYSMCQVKSQTPSSVPSPSPSYCSISMPSPEKILGLSPEEQNENYDIS